MATYQIFEHTLFRNNEEGNDPITFAVWVADGQLQYVIDGEIQHDIEDVNDFLIAAAEYINKGDDDNVGNLSFSGGGTISDDSLENYDSAGGVVLDRNGSAPTISLQDDATAVKFSGSEIGGSFTVDFGSNDRAVDEAAAFQAFADDLLGKTETIKLDTISANISGLQTVKISQRVDDIKKVQFKDSGDARDDSWADAFIDQLGDSLGGTKTNNGNVSESGYTANQLNISDDGLSVNLGSSGVGGKEVWAFDDPAVAQEFFDDIKAAFQDGDRRDIINSAIEGIAADLGGTQTKNGNVSTNYEARQIKLFGDDLSNVDLGSHRVGGKETYAFADQDTAQKFIDTVRDLLGVEGTAKKIVDEFIFDVSGLGVSGTETFLGKDAFIEYLGADIYGGTLTRDGAVSESFNGASSQTDNVVKLGPSGVGGKEIWTFETDEDATAFAAALDTYIL